ncbi:hypothetical protein MRX96_055983 [Rhipicephalus microplus]
MLASAQRFTTLSNTEFNGRHSRRVATAYNSIWKNANGKKRGRTSAGTTTNAFLHRFLESMRQNQCGKFSCLSSPWLRLHYLLMIRLRDEAKRTHTWRRILSAQPCVPEAGGTIFTVFIRINARRDTKYGAPQSGGVNAG